MAVNFAALQAIIDKGHRDVADAESLAVKPKICFARVKSRQQIYNGQQMAVSMNDILERLSTDGLLQDADLRHRLLAVSSLMNQPHRRF